MAMEVLTEFGERHSFKWIEKWVPAERVVVLVERRSRSNRVVNRSRSDAKIVLGILYPVVLSTSAYSPKRSDRLGPNGVYVVGVQRSGRVIERVRESVEDVFHVRLATYLHRRCKA